jgi:hypothetical protein
MPDNDLSPAAATLTAVFSSAVPAAPQAAPTAPLVVEPHSHAGLTDAQGAQIIRDIRDDLAKGKISQAVADARFNEMHTPLDQRVVPSDIRTEEQKLIDDHFPVAKESDYLIRYFPPGREPQVMPKELQEFDQTARTWLSGAEFPRELGNSLIVSIERTAQATKHMDANQLEQYGSDEFEKLTRAYGGEDKLQEKLRAAAVMIDALDKKQPGLKNLLRSKGIGDSALVVAQIIGQSDR